VSEAAGRGAALGDSSARARLRAEQLLAMHRPQEALQVLTAALASDPDDVSSYCLAARAELALQHPERALDLASRAAALAPAEEWPMRLVALAAAGLGRTHEALDAALRACALEPDTWETQHTLAHVCLKVPGQGARAWDAARRATELAPLEASAHAVMGRVALESGDTVTAERALREALRLDPDHAVAMNDLGRLQLKRKDHFGAAAHFARAASSDARLDVAVHNIDVALTVAVARIFFWVWIVLITLGRVAVLTTGRTAVLAGVGALVALAGLVGWQATKIAPAFRGRLGGYLRQLPRRDRLLTAMVALIAVGMVSLVVMCVAPPGSVRVPPLIVGIVALIACRILIAVRSRRLRRARD
jgi:Flp pilus assembly protein TadD